MERRTFLKGSVFAGGAVLIGFHLPVYGKKSTLSESNYSVNAWIRVDAANQITFIIHKSEMGQGVLTGLSMLMAEELNTDVSLIKTEFAPVGEVYSDSINKRQVTGNSTSIKSSWLSLRQASANTRELFRQAAAQHWNVNLNELEMVDASIRHQGSRKSVPLSELIYIVETLKLPETAILKPANEFRFLGKPTRRLDTPQKINGSAKYGIDIRLPNMLFATVIHPPRIGAQFQKIEHVDSNMPGVRKVFGISNGVAIVADSTWQALAVREKIKIKWNQSNSESFSDKDLFKTWRHIGSDWGDDVRDEGDVKNLFKNTSDLIDAEYTLPFQAHATMEPMNCTAQISQERCDVWVPTQNQGGTHALAKRLTGLDEEQVHVHTTFLGGGFGRRGETDFVLEALEIALEMRMPVQVLWSREEDIQHDYYRPAAYHRLRAVLTKNGYPIAWYHHIVMPSLLTRVISQSFENRLPSWIPDSIASLTENVVDTAFDFVSDPTSVSGAEEMPYRVANVRVDYSKVESVVPVGFWRSVGYSVNGFVVESFIDELAHVAGIDPYQYRRELLKHNGKMLTVLDVAAQKSQWKEKRANGKFLGMAVVESFDSTVAQVAEVTINKEKELKVERITCVVDCGFAVNPAQVEAQMQGAIAFGLSATLKSKISIDQGKVQQSNFHDFEVLRFSEMPQVDVYIIPSNEPPQGVGEPGVPPVAPAVSNAIFAATNKRFRELPITPQKIREVL